MSVSILRALVLAFCSSQNSAENGSAPTQAHAHTHTHSLEGHSSRCLAKAEKDSFEYKQRATGDNCS